MKRLGILVVSDRASRGVYPDASGPAIAEWAAGAGLTVEALNVVPDEPEHIEARLRTWADDFNLDLILTSGGTGFGPRDVTPEATLAVLERPTPGIPEHLRLATAARTPRAVLSRAVAGLRGRTLIVNLPGAPQAARDWLAILEPLLPHAFAMVEGHPHGDAVPHA